MDDHGGPTPVAPDADTRTGVDLRAAYNAHGAELYRFAHRQLGDAGAAQDVVQETFLRAWRASDRYDPEIAGLRTWLFGIARNAVIDHVRRVAIRPWQGRPDVLPADRSPGAGDPDAHGFAESVLDGWVVEEALRRISPEHRSAIVATHLRERPYEEVAAEQGVPVGTLRSRVFYGLRALRLALDEMGVEL